jgi:hypothetical protein
MFGDVLTMRGLSPYTRVGEMRTVHMAQMWLGEVVLHLRLSIVRDLLGEIKI